MNWILDILFPKFCVGCNKSGSYVCTACEVGLWEQDQICPGCHKTSLGGLTHRSCKETTYLDGLVCFWAYEGIAKKLLHRANNYFIFDYLVDLTRQSGILLNRSDFARLKSFMYIHPTLVSLPDEPHAKNKKGFASGDIVAQAIARLYRLPRWRLRLSKSQKMPAQIILVGDVWSKPEFEKWAELLKKQGATQVWGLTLAR